MQLKNNRAISTGSEKCTVFRLDGENVKTEVIEKLGEVKELSRKINYTLKLTSNMLPFFYLTIC